MTQMASDSHNPPDARVRELEAEVDVISRAAFAPAPPNLAAERWRELWEQAQTENDRLRCALARIASLAYPAKDGSEAEYMADVAREALEAGER